MSFSHVSKSQTQQQSPNSNPNPKSSPPSSPPHEIIALQRRYGNQAVRRMLAEQGQTLPADAALIQRQPNIPAMMGPEGGSSVASTAPDASSTPQPATDRTVEYTVGEVTTPPVVQNFFVGLGWLTMSTTATTKGSVSLTEKGADGSRETKIDGKTGEMTAKKEWGDAANKIGVEITAEGPSVTLGGDAHPMDYQIQGNAIIFKPKPIKHEQDHGDYKSVVQMEISFKMAFSGTFSGYGAAAMAAAVGVAVAGQKIAAALGAFFSTLAEGFAFGVTRAVQFATPLIIIIPPGATDPGYGRPPDMA